MRRVAWYLAIALATITLLILLWQLRQAVILFLFSLAVAAAFRPLIERWRRRGIPRGLSLILAYLAVLIPLVGLLVLASGPLVRDLELASNRLATNYELITATWPENGTPLQRAIARQLPPAPDLYNWLAGEQGNEAGQALLGMTANVFGFVGNLGIILILSLYWNADSAHFERIWLSLLAVKKRAQAREIWRSIESGVGAYIRSEIFQSLLAGVMLWLGYRVLGMDYPVLLALFGALAWLVPWFGAIIAVIPVLLIGLSSGVAIGVIAALYTLLILLIQEAIIQPRLFPQQSYSSVLLVLVILAMADAFGLIGLVIAPLLAAAIQITMMYLAQPTPASSPPSLEPDPLHIELDSLHEQLSLIRGKLGSRDETSSPEMHSLIDRLENLIDETERAFTEKAAVSSL